MKVAIRMTSQTYRAGVIIVTGTDNDPKKFVQKEMELIVREVGMSTIDKTRRVSCPYREVA